MSNTKDVLEGITILLKYCTVKDGYNLSAEHDVLYFSATDQVVSEQDFDRLSSLGWSQDIDTDDEDDEAGYALYDKNKGWQTFV